MRGPSFRRFGTGPRRSCDRPLAHGLLNLPPVHQAERILFATDFSPYAALALDLAGETARGLQAEVVVLHVDATAEAAPLSLEALSRREAARQGLEKAQQRLRDANVTASTLLRPGDPAREILRVATLQAARMIVVASHGWTRSSTLLLGSVADRVVRYAPVPVLVVRHPDRRAPDPLLSLGTAVKPGGAA